MPYLLTIEIVRVADDYRASVIDLGDDAVLFISDNFPDAGAAVRAAQAWITENE